MVVRGKKRAGVILFISVLLMSTIPRIPIEVHAAEPGAMQFATKEQLLNSFDTDDTTNKAAKKILFGQNGSGAGQEWHIVGKDPAAGNTDGLVLFAASPLMEGEQFNSSQNAKNYTPPAGTGYDSTDTITVNARHYGASDLRVKLKELEKNTAYFSTEEQARMMETAVYNYDSYCNDLEGDEYYFRGRPYSTWDKLYVAHLNDLNPNPADLNWTPVEILAGTSDNRYGGLKITLNEKYCWTVQNVAGPPYGGFWLRVCGQEDKGRVVCKRTGGIFGGIVEVTDKHAVVPAFQLDLSSVLFASAAPAAGSEGAVSVTDESPFTLRYRAADGEIGKADLQNGGKSVAVTGVSGSGTYLVVQNDAGAYAKAVNSDAVVEAKDITIGGSALSSFSGCKVWLEKTDSGRITKAVMAESKTPVYSISVDKDTLAFDARNEGYGEGERPQEQTVTVTNDGNSAVVLKQPISTSGNYEIGALDKTSLAPTEEAVFTVQPKKSLKAGSYNEIIEIQTEQNTSANVETSFIVNGQLTVSVTPRNAEIAEGGTVTLSVAAAGGSGNYTYAWYEENNGVSFASTQSVDVSPAATATYKVVVTDTIEEKEAAATVTVVPKNYAAEFVGSGVLGRLCTGYTDVPAWMIHIKNVGNVEITNLQASLDGENKDAFILDTSGASSSVLAGAETAFTVKAAAGLAAGTYKGQIEATGDNGIKEAMNIVFTVADHDFDGAWSSDDKEHWKSCSNPECQEISARAAHIDENQDDICEVCGRNIGAKKQNQNLNQPNTPAGIAGGSGGPKTGDENRPGMWGVICVLSGISSVALYIKGKTKRKSHRYR